VQVDIEVNDADILRIEEGPWAYMRSVQFKRMNLEEFRKTVIEKFAEIGFRASVNAYTTDAGADVYAFEVVVHDRLEGAFDPDQMVHEVVSNVLELPDQDQGWIDTDQSLRAAEAAMREKPHHH
jgi:hypothetical protein